jgi:hypothetical protein
MTKEEFIDFIKELGFINTWQSIDDKYHMETDIVGQPNQNSMAFVDQLKINIIDDIVQLSLSQMSSHITAGKNFGNFSLKTFGDKNDFQLEIFLSFIKGAFKNPPKNIIQYMRDRKIKNILK